MSPELEVAVIGAGPHGLSAGVHLRRAGLKAHVFGTPMGFWKSMPEGMKLRSNMRATNMIEATGPLSLTRYGEERGRPVEPPVPLDRFIDYGLWVQQTAVPDVDNRRVTQVAKHNGGFALSLSDGESLTARRVVLACGISAFEHMPAGFEHVPPERMSHTAQHADLGRFAGRRVLVVGGGQSAFESAALMSERGARSVEVLVRRPTVVWLRGHSIHKRIGPLAPIVYAPTDVGPLWYSRLVSQPDLFRRLPRAAQDRIARRSIRPACSHFVRVRLGDVVFHTGVSVTGVDVHEDGLRVSVSDGTVREVDDLMFGTGYRVDFARYDFLSAGLRDSVRQVNGYPVLRRGLETSIDGLHVLGAPAAWSFGPIMRFVSGSWYGGQALARAVS